ncbi:MAG: two-component system, NarL family, nitrate/nitrite response regulator NarL [Acidobacteriota bacterium]|jgi:DNA-binding NarL/FixJ family response regulator|nr:two-component system, NarL family, nitrate/nitrite response regulator NarL [Acidobacteriota bacterium]
MEDLRVLVVSDDPLARTGLALLLADRDGLVVSGQAGTDDDWPGPDAPGTPHVIVWDLGLGPQTGLPLLREATDPTGPPILAIVADEADAQEALAAGVRGALPRNADGDRLSAALRAVAQGLLILDESFAALLLHDAPVPPEELAEPLTPRELEVLQLLSQGLPNKRIAQRLGISEHTAKFHVNAILGKLGVQSRSEAIVHAVRLGLVVL